MSITGTPIVIIDGITADPYSGPFAVGDQVPVNTGVTNVVHPVWVEKRIRVYPRAAIPKSRLYMRPFMDVFGGIVRHNGTRPRGWYGRRHAMTAEELASEASNLPPVSGGSSGVTAADAAQGYTYPTTVSEQDLVYQSFEQANPTAQSPWFSQPSLEFISPTLEFLRFNPDSTIERGASPASNSLVSGSLSGFIIWPSFKMLNFFNDKDRHGFPLPTDGVGGLEWVGKKPTGGDVLGIDKLLYWETIVRDEAPRVSMLTYRNQLPNEVIRAETKDKVPANSQHLFVVRWLGVTEGHDTNKGIPGWRLEWGGKYSIVCRLNQPPALEYRYRDDNGQLIWYPLGALPGAPNCTFAPAEWTFGIFRWAGRICILLKTGGDSVYLWHCMTIKEGTGSIANASDRASRAAEDDDPYYVESAWAPARLGVQSYGVQFALGGSAVQYDCSNHTDEDLAVTCSQIRSSDLYTAANDVWKKLADQTGSLGSFDRASFRRFAKVAGDEGCVGAIQRRTKPFIPDATGTPTALVAPAFHGKNVLVSSNGKVNTLSNGQLDLTYTVGLVSSKNETPFLMRCSVGAYQKPTDEDPPTPLDIGPAVLAAKATYSMPPQQCGVRWEMEVDADILESLGASAVDPPDFGEFLTEWTSQGSILNPDAGSRLDGTSVRDGLRAYCYTQEFNPIEIELRLQYSNGSRTDWCRMLKGYIVHANRDSAPGSKRKVTLIANDPTYRLQAPAAVIDYKWPPLDFFFVAKNANHTGFGYSYTNPDGTAMSSSLGSSPYWGSEAIRDILAMAAGIEEANRLNGNGNPFRYTPPTQYPLLGQSGRTMGYFMAVGALGGEMPSSDKFFLTPPWDQDALTWIRQISEKDYFVFFYGYPPTDGNGVTQVGGQDWPCPIYGRLPYILAAKNANPITLPDNVYVSGDIVKFINRMSKSTRPEIAYNRAIAEGDPGGDGSIQAIAPAANIGESNLPPEHPHSARKTWERTLIIRNNIIATETRREGAKLTEEVAQVALNEFNIPILDLPKFNLWFNPYFMWGDVVVPKLLSYSGEGGYVGDTGDYSDVLSRLHGHKFRVRQVEHSLNWQSGSFGTALSSAPLSATGL